MYDIYLGCYKITAVFSHAQTAVLCVSCSTVLCQPTGGRARLTEGNGCSINILGCSINRLVVHKNLYLIFLFFFRLFVPKEGSINSVT